jgi:hypothetical protein
MAKNVKLNVDEKSVELENYRISKEELIPEWEIVTHKATETVTSAENEVMGYSSNIIKTTTIRLRPKIYYENLRDDLNAPKESKK